MPASTSPTPSTIGSVDLRAAGAGRTPEPSPAARRAAAAARVGVGGVASAARPPDDDERMDGSDADRRSPADGWLPMLVDQSARGCAFAWPPDEPTDEPVVVSP